MTYNVFSGTLNPTQSTIVCVSVCLSVAAFPHYCMDPDVTWGNGRGALSLCTIGRICNRCTGFVAITTYHEREMLAIARTASIPGFNQ